MTFTRSFRWLTPGLLLVVALPASSALGATKKPPVRPNITSVAPLTLGVGDMLTIRGKNFVIGKKTNSVAFKRAGAPAVFVKAAESTRTRMKVIVPDSLRKYLTRKDGVAQPTRFRMRVLARRFAKAYTAEKLSPTISDTPDAPGAVGGPGDAKAPAPGAGPATGPTNTTPAPPASPVPPAPPADCDQDGTPDATDADDDNDNLSDVLEATIKTNPCAKDSDGDGLEDSWEYYSALDLNSSNVPAYVPGAPAPTPPATASPTPAPIQTPYAGKRPYPNPLDGADAGYDHDGDGMTSREEHMLWVKFGARSLPVNYSDGTQFTGPPVDATSPATAFLNITAAGDGAYDAAYLSDDEKDADVDRLGNWDETHGRMNAGWWKANFKLEDPQFPLASVYRQPDFLDPDTDGDGILDGNDDQDHDDIPNFDDLRRVNWMMHPFNPCLPDVESRTCPRYLPPEPPFYAPFDKMPLPAVGDWEPWPRP